MNSKGLMNYSMGYMSDNKRIEWVDIAKGIAIVLMIIGHTVPYGSKVRNFIFSFHMPFFLILTGFTIKEITYKHAIKSYVIKDFKRLVIPYITVEIIEQFVNIFLYKMTLREAIYALSRSLFGYKISGWIPVWFLMFLFDVKLIYYFIEYIFNEYSLIIYLLLSFAGKTISSVVHMPLYFDVALVCVLFLYVGHLIKIHNDSINKNYFIITILSFITWMIPLDFGIYIETYPRNYPCFVICIIEAIGGSICFIYLSYSISKFTNHLNKILSNIGTNTLLMLCVHQLDTFFSFVWIITENAMINSIIRVIFDIAVTYTLLVLKNVIASLLQNRFSRE